MSCRKITDSCKLDQENRKQPLLAKLLESPFVYHSLVQPPGIGCEPRIHSPLDEVEWEREAVAGEKHQSATRPGSCPRHVHSQNWRPLSTTGATVKAFLTVNLKQKELITGGWLSRMEKIRSQTWNVRLSGCYNSSAKRHLGLEVRGQRQALRAGPGARWHSRSSRSTCRGGAKPAYAERRGDMLASRPIPAPSLASW